MDLAVFNKLAAKQAQFVVNYRKLKNPSFITWGVVTADLTCKYIQDRLKSFRRKPKAGQVLLWNWRYDSPLILDLDQVVSVQPHRLDRPERL